MKYIPKKLKIENYTNIKVLQTMFHLARDLLLMQQFYVHDVCELIVMQWLWTYGGIYILVQMKVNSHLFVVNMASV